MIQKIRNFNILLVVTGGLFLLAACDSGTQENTGAVTQQPPALSIDDIAERYVKLALAIGQHDPAFVDAYYGPEEWQEQIEEKDLTSLQEETQALMAALQALAVPDEELVTLRHRYLQKQLHAANTRMDMMSGKQIPFNQETAALYDAIAPDYDVQQFQDVLDQIDQLLPGDTPLPERVENFRQQFVIPVDKLQTVFDAAIAECRNRTLEYVALPEGENFTVEYVNDKPWSGYNWYQGNRFSLIQVNTDLPIFIERAVDLGCHEGYPGHHTYNALLEEELVNKKGWVEFSIYPLFSPQSLIAEGSANYGINMAFPGEERIQFEKEVLFPLAGLDAENAELYYQILAFLEALDHVDNYAGRAYLDGDIDREQAIQVLIDYRLNSPERAAQRVDFFDTYRGYIINYNLGQEMVRDYVERQSDSSDSAWEIFSGLLASPKLPSDLKQDE